MNKSEFDKYADEYHSTLQSSISMSGEAPEYFTEYKIRDIFNEYFNNAKPTLSPSLNILDFGVGTGESVPFFQKYFPNANLTGLDVSQQSLKIAEERFSSAGRFVHFNGQNIPFPSGCFDIVYVACVFHHIDHSEHVSLLKEIHRVLRPNGYLFVFEHNPYNPLTVRVVKNCPLDVNAQLIDSSSMKERVMIAGFNTIDTRYRIFFPHALRVLRPLERMFKWLPLGAQYYVCARA